MPTYDPKPNKLKQWAENRSVMDSGPAKVGKAALRGLQTIMGGDDLVSSAMPTPLTTIGPKAIPLNDYGRYVRKIVTDVMEDITSGKNVPKKLNTLDNNLANRFSIESKLPGATRRFFEGEGALANFPEDYRNKRADQLLQGLINQFPMSEK